MACYPNFHTFLEMEYLYVRLFACLFPILGFIQNHLCLYVPDLFRCIFPPAVLKLEITTAWSFTSYLFRQFEQLQEKKAYQ